MVPVFIKPFVYSITWLCISAKLLSMELKAKSSTSRILKCQSGDTASIDLRSWAQYFTIRRIAGSGMYRREGRVGMLSWQCDAFIASSS